MTKGKYAARAANREARLDNELIAEKVNQVAALQPYGGSVISQPDWDDLKLMVPTNGAGEPQ
jgi:hypothetical protein